MDDALCEQTHTVSGYMPRHKAEDLVRRAGTAELRSGLSDYEWGRLLYPYAGYSNSPDWAPFSIEVPLKAHGPLVTVRRWVSKLNSLQRDARVIFWFDN